MSESVKYSTAASDVDLEQLSFETVVEIGRTFGALKVGIEETLKPFELSGPLYRVLRVLRDIGADGASCQEVAGSLSTRDPDVTRLLDRLEDRGLVTRVRAADDRRVVRACLTDEGRRVVEALEEPIARLHVRQVGHLGEEALRALIGTMRSLREGLE